MTTATSAAAVVLPEPVMRELENRIDRFIAAEGFSEVEPASLLAGDWHDAARFPNHRASAMALPDADLHAVTKAILLLESAEPALLHARFRVTYRLGYASPEYPDVRHSYVEVARFNLGPARHADVVQNYGADAAPIEEFGIGPSVTWRFVTTEVMGIRADPVRASRKVVSQSEETASDCLGAGCNALAGSDGPQGDWQEFSTDIGKRQVVYADRNGAIPAAARMADDLLAHATPHGEEPAGPEGQSMVFVISMNVEGQDEMASGLLLQDNLQDDAVAQIWTRRVAIGEEFDTWSQVTIGR